MEGKWLLRRILEKHVPKSLFERPKSGFSVPLHQWLRGPLKTWGDDLLSLDRLKKQNILSAELVAGRWKDFQAGRGGHANATDLWAALMFQSWHARWME
jgi:asparagine synthase (glutamine-hydrolysing)